MTYKEIIKWIVLMSLLLSTLSGCNDDPQTLSSIDDDGKPTANIAEAYVGTFKLRRLYQCTLHVDRIDSVLLNLSQDAGTYRLTHLEHNTTVCDSEGSIFINISAGTAILVPDINKTGNGSCDTVRVPSGILSAIFTDTSLTMVGGKIVSSCGVDDDTLTFTLNLRPLFTSENSPAEGL